MSARRPVRIGNVSGFYGDRFSAMDDMLRGGPVDVVTGDYLAELTMLILWKARRRNASAGYATTFLAQLETTLGTAMEGGVRIVTNAGGLNPSGLAEEIRQLAHRLGLSPKVAHIEGDDLVSRVPELLAAGHELRHLDTSRPLRDAGVEPVTANAYLGAWGIAEALHEGADIVVCPRVTDASLVVGPAAWWHGWARDDLDELAGAVAAGHVIECGPQATGGNYPWLDEVVDRRYPGYPIAEIASDGSSIIAKHPDTGGVVSVGTVTAQLLYEIADPAYPNPDVVAHFDTVELTQVAADRVQMSQVRGSAPSGMLKVSMAYDGGYRNTMTLVLTGLDIEKKAELATTQLFEILGGEEQFDAVDVRLIRYDQPDAPSNAQATAELRVSVRHSDKQLVGRRFSNATMELYLAGYAGFHTTTPPSEASSFGVYWPTLVSASEVLHEVVLPDGSRRTIEHSPTTDAPAHEGRAVVRPDETPSVEDRQTVRVPLGTICGARSGDKGGNANIGLWVRSDREYAWLRSLTVGDFRQLLPEAAGLEIRRYELPNLRALNFVVVGLLGNGVSDSARPDPQAKGLGEYIRSRFIDLPVSLTLSTPKEH